MQACGSMPCHGVCTAVCGLASLPACGAAGVGLDLSTTGFKANLFNKDFKKQVLAADALKAWVLDNPHEVRAEACCSFKQGEHTHAKASDGTQRVFLLTLGPMGSLLLVGVLVHPLACSAWARPVCRRWSRVSRAWTCCCAGAYCAWLTATRRRWSASPACSRCVARGLARHCIVVWALYAVPPRLLWCRCQAVWLSFLWVCMYTGPV